MRGWPVGWSVGWLRASPPRSVALRSRPTAIPNLWSGLVHQAAVTRRSFTRVRDSSPFEARDSVRVADHPRSWDYQGFQHISPIAPRIAALSTRHRHFRSRNFGGKRIDLVPLCFVNSESLFFFFRSRICWIVKDIYSFRNTTKRERLCVEIFDGEDGFI